METLENFVFVAFGETNDPETREEYEEWEGESVGLDGCICICR
jgi:hypothetical protein